MKTLRRTRDLVILQKLSSIKKRVKLMIITETEGDIFTDRDPDYKLAHCIAADAGMGKGIAVDFVAKFPQIFSLREMSLTVGTTYYVDPVFNLVTKRRSPGKPSYESMCETLRSFRDVVLEHKIDKIAMPRIGCGLDLLSWPAVREMVKDVFKPVDVKFVIFNFKKI